MTPSKERPKIQAVFSTKLLTAAPLNDSLPMTLGSQPYSTSIWRLRMVSLSALWLPIVLSAVIVFIASSIMHMVLPYHRGDYQPLPD
jgi:hypothetical protein